MQYKLNANKFIFLFIGRLLWDKGYKEIIEAAKKIHKDHSNIEFQIIGGFDKQPSSISKKIILKDHSEGIINYLGYQQETRDYMQKADCILLPSYHEGMSRVLMEAAAMAKPIIASNIPGCQEIVEDGVNGFLIKAQDSEDLYFKLNKILALSQEDLKIMSKESRRIAVTKFNIKNVISVYDEIINDL